jgi:nucleoside-diphosphate-sugar epimerase
MTERGVEVTRESRRILVTGASGFVGRQTLAPLVRRGYQVHGVSRGEATPNAREVVWHHCDLFDPVAIRALIETVQPTHLLHLAWCAVPGAYLMSPDNLEWVTASIRLARAFSEYGGRRIVVAGTSAEYDWRYGYCTEDVTPLAPTTLYGTAKHALHLMLEQFATQVGISCAWARLFFLYGPFERPGRLVSTVVEGLRDGRQVPCTHGTQLRDFLHVADAGDALAAVADSDVRGAINIASGEPVSVKQIVDRIALRFGRQDLVRFGAIESTDAPFVIARVDRLRREIGWAPRRSLDEGLANTIEWWLRSGEVSV